MSDLEPHDARTVVFRMHPSRTNHITNPCFAYGFDGWAVSSGTATVQIAQTAPRGGMCCKAGDAGGLLTHVGPGGLGTVAGGGYVTLSAYAQGGVTLSLGLSSLTGSPETANHLLAVPTVPAAQATGWRRVSMTMDLRAAQRTLVATHLGRPEADLTETDIANAMDTTPGIVVATLRPVIALAPGATVTGVLLERTSRVRDFFDGDTGTVRSDENAVPGLTFGEARDHHTFQDIKDTYTFGSLRGSLGPPTEAETGAISSDFVWLGEPGRSASGYYYARALRNLALLRGIGDRLPLGAHARISFTEG